MGRLVRIPKQAVLAEATEAVERPEHRPRAPDNYLERIAKYFPGEVLAFFIVINAILEQAMKSGGEAATMAGLPVTTVALGALAVGVAMVPLFAWYVREQGDAWLTNALVSTLLFPFWAYALGAAAFNTTWDGNLAAILLVTATVLSGLVLPPARLPRRQPSTLAPAAALGIPARTERPQLDLITPA